MLEDLRNYRSLAASGNPQSTMAMNPDVNATVAMSPAGLRGVHSDDTSAVARSLSARAAHPGQTPILPPHREPCRRSGAQAKKNVFATVFVALLLLGVIGYCANKLRPIYEDVRQQRRASASRSEAASSPVTDTVAAQNDDAGNAGTEASTENSDPAASDANPKDAVAPATPPVLDVKSAHVERPPAKKPESVLSTKAADTKAASKKPSPNKGWLSRQSAGRWQHADSFRKAAPGRAWNAAQILARRACECPPD